MKFVAIINFLVDDADVLHRRFLDAKFSKAILHELVAPAKERRTASEVAVIHVDCGLTGDAARGVAPEVEVLIVLGASGSCFGDEEQSKAGASTSPYMALRSSRQKR